MKDDKSILAAILLNLFIPGAGYMYMGRVFLGILAFFFATFAIFLTAGIAWFPWALIMSVDMLLLKNKREKDLLKQMKKCPQCAELVQAEAHVCRYCNCKFGGATSEAA